MKAIELLDKFAQQEGCGNWFTLVSNYHPSVVEMVAIAAVNEALGHPPVISSVCNKCGGHIDTDSLGRYCTCCEKYVD